MPPGRRGRPPGSSNGSKSRPTPQSTLAFGGRSNKITKPSVPPPSSKKASKPNERQTKDISQVIEDETPAAEADEVKDEVVDEDQSLAEGRETTFAIREREARKEEEAVDPAEEKARTVSDAAVKRYWRAKEEERKAPRVHQQQLSLHEKILRHFDLSSQYGPCVGIPRMRRWKRAEGLGLKPPIEVLAVLVKEQDGGVGKESAFMDGLLGGSAVYA
ncbi:MAG: hypothetical protein Q9207_001470 [Kuettlingeria erythrocarpa]